jgi:hypothetical protein
LAHEATLSIVLTSRYVILLQYTFLSEEIET